MPYRLGGRDAEGMDCYGLVIECFRREGKELRDLTRPVQSELVEHLETLNVREVDGPAQGLGVQYFIDGRLHIGYMVSRRDVLHMTESGARITPLMALGRFTPSFFEVIG